MTTTLFRTMRATLLAVAVVAACASTASAANQNYDSSYKTTLLPGSHGAKRVSATSCEALSNNKFAIVGKIGGGSPTDLATRGKRQHIAILTADTNGDSQRGWRPVKTRAGEQLLASDFAANGDFAYVSAPLADKKSRKFVVRKVRASGKPASSWRDVTLKLPALKGNVLFTNVNVMNLRDGGVLVVVDRRDAQRIYRFDPSGRTVAGFGTKGILTLAAAAVELWYLPTNAATALLETHDGSLIVAASARPGQPAGPAQGLLKLNANGTPVASFADQGFWTPPASFPDEAPVTGTSTRHAPYVMSVLGGQAAGDPLTVLSASTVQIQVGTVARVGATQLSETGVQQSISASFDEESNAGDGGFPDAEPFTFVKSAGGFTYASGWTELWVASTSRANGTLAGLTTNLAPPVKQVSVVAPASRFAALDYAATPDGKYVYACGASSNGRTMATDNWKTYVPALRRFKL